MVGCVYLFTTPSKKHYVGITICSVEERWRNHRKADTHCTLVKRAIDKYGWDNIKKEVLLYCAEEELAKYEKQFIEVYNSLAPNGLNCTSGGEGGKTLSDETKANITSGLNKYYATHSGWRRGRTGTLWSEEMKQNVLRKRAQKATGITWREDLNKYKAYIPRLWNNGKQKYLGVYETRELAQAAIDDWRASHTQV
jgi:group I intron endonuclease